MFFSLQQVVHLGNYFRQLERRQIVLFRVNDVIQPHNYSISRSDNEEEIDGEKEEEWLPLNELFLFSLEKIMGISPFKLIERMKGVQISK